MKKLIAILILFSLMACKHKDETSASAPPSPPPDWPNVAESLDAVARSYSHAQKICYDEKWGYFLDYGPRVSGKQEDDGRWHGMFLLNWPEVKFHKASNNTYWIDEVGNDKLHEGYVDLTGLQCVPGTMADQK